MRAFSLTPLAIVVIAAAVFPAAPLGATSGSTTAVLATGTVRALDLARITVNRSSCLIPAKLQAASAQFAVGEHVTIGCSAGVLQRIALEPIVSGHSHFLPFTVSSAVAPKSSSNPYKASRVWSSGGNAFGGSMPTSQPVSISVTGPITAFDSMGITVGGERCPFFGSNPSVDLSGRLPESGRSNIAIGDTAEMSCTFTETSSSGHFFVSKS